MLKGIGLFYFSPESDNQFRFSQESPIQPTIIDPGTFFLRIDASSKFPCSCLITGTQEGYVIAPSLKVAVSEGSDLVLMLLLPAITPHRVSVEKTILTIPDAKATVTISTDGGALQCTGDISTHGFKRAALVLDRNPGIELYRKGFNQTLCEIKEPGEISAVWKPVSTAFEECLVAFYPSSLNSVDPGEVAQHLGAPEEEFGEKSSDYVVGDGAGVDYTLRLVLDRGLGRHSSDETRLTVT